MLKNNNVNKFLVSFNKVKIFLFMVPMFFIFGWINAADIGHKYQLMKSENRKKREKTYKSRYYENDVRSMLPKIAKNNFASKQEESEYNKWINRVTHHGATALEILDNSRYKDTVMQRTHKKWSSKKNLQKNQVFRS